MVMNDYISLSEASKMLGKSKHLGVGIGREFLVR